MRLSYILAAAIAGALLAMPAMTVSQKGLKDCNQLADPDREITGCASYQR
jgi:hypothetical protein